MKVLHNTVWHENITVVKFYSLPVHRLDKKVIGILILQKPHFVLDLVVI